MSSWAVYAGATTGTKAANQTLQMPLSLYDGGLGGVGLSVDSLSVVVNDPGIYCWYAMAFPTLSAGGYALLSTAESILTSNAYDTAAGTRECRIGSTVAILADGPGGKPYSITPKVTASASITATPAWLVLVARLVTLD